jgi:uncharacterized protein (TIGR03437 family)
MRYVLVLFAGASLCWGGTYGNIPLFFEPNVGQAGPEVKFLARAPGGNLFFTEEGLVLAQKASVVRAMFLGGSGKPRIEGAGLLKGKSNYLIGAEPEKWHTGIPQYGQVLYGAVYPGVDVLFYGDGQTLEYDLVVWPGAEIERITIAFEGIDSGRIEGNGDLVLETQSRELRQKRPVIYQEVDGVRRQVAGKYVLKGKGCVGFETANYERARPLVIDPVLVYSTYLGETTSTYVPSLAVDADGHAYVAGSTRAGNFPTTPGSFQPAYNDTSCYSSMTPSRYIPCSDAFVSKLDADGTGLVFSTYLGGDRDDFATGIAVDLSGNVYVTGITSSSDFPTTPGAVSGDAHRFIAKLDPTGTVLLYSTTGAGGGKIALDPAGNIYLATGSELFTGGGAVKKLDAAGSRVIYSFDFPGTASAITVDGAGGAYAAGNTTNPSFPVTHGAFQTAPAGGPTANGDAFAMKLNPSGGLIYSTFLGGSGEDYANAIAVDASGSAFVAGGTTSSDFPVTPGAAQSSFHSFPYLYFPYPDAFVAKLDPMGAKLVYSTYIGGGEQDVANAIAVDATGNAYIAGLSRSGDFPTTRGAFQPCLRYLGEVTADAFVTKVNSDGMRFTYSTLVGGTNQDTATDIGIDAAGNAYIAGVTQSDDFPTVDGAFQRANPHPTYPAAFVAKVNDLVAGPLASVCVVNAASFIHGPVAPGEIVTVLNAHTGPAAGVVGQVNSQERFGTQVAETRLLFDGIPAPLLYVQENQINAIVPYEIAGRPTVLVQIECRGAATDPALLRVAESDPAVFTLEMTGRGQGAILNQDGSVNSASNPAKRGSYVSIYATGEGTTEPPGVDGKLAAIALPKPVLPVQVYFNGMETEVQYAGGAQGLTAGVIQINAKVPETIPCCGSATVLLKIGEATSPPNVTLEVGE